MPRSPQMNCSRQPGNVSESGRDALVMLAARGFIDMRRQAMADDRGSQRTKTLIRDLAVRDPSLQRPD
jgi:hypothetical protein